MKNSETHLSPLWRRACDTEMTDPFSTANVVTRRLSQSTLIRQSRTRKLAPCLSNNRRSRSTLNCALASICFSAEGRDFGNLRRLNRHSDTEFLFLTFETSEVPSENWVASDSIVLRRFPRKSFSIPNKSSEQNKERTKIYGGAGRSLSTICATNSLILLELFEWSFVGMETC